MIVARLIFLGFLGALMPVYATSQSTPEGFALGRINSAIDRFMEDSAGERPTDWNQLDQYVSFAYINEVLSANKTEPIQRNYSFVPPELGFRDERGYPVIIIRHTPVQESGRTAGRYLIVLSGGGVSGAIASNCCPTLRWLEETNVQQLLGTAKIQLPAPRIDADQAVNAALNEKLKEDAATERTATFVYYKVRALQKLRAAKDWLLFANSSENRSLSGRPLLSVAIALGAMTALAFLLIRFCKRSSGKDWKK
jgi:hypothetical protein